MFSGNGNSKVLPTNQPTNGLTWVGARDACASKNCNWAREPDAGDLDIGQHAGALDSLGSQEDVESHQLLLGKKPSEFP